MSLDPHLQQTEMPEPMLVQLELVPVHVTGELIEDRWWVEPAPKAKPYLMRHLVFIITFVAPVLLTTFYMVFLAANQYICESHFIVRTASHNDVGNLASLVVDQKMSRASDETYAIVEFLKSRDAVDALEKRVDVVSMFGKAGTDILFRYPMFGQSPNKERLLYRYLRSTDVTVSGESGIASLRTMAFTPEDAVKMNEALLQEAEGVVNRLNARAYGDGLILAQNVVADFRSKVAQIETELTKFRNDARLVDPTKETVAAMTQLSTLTGKLAEAQVELSRLVELTAASPQIEPIRERITALQREIERERGRLAGGSSSISDSYAKFDQLSLEQSLVAKGLEVAMQHLVSAQQDASRQSYYLQRVVQPGLPDLPGYPHRFLTILAVAALSYAVYRMVNAFARSVMEHKP